MKMILDVDTGIDDALAIAYAIGKEEVDLIGITTVFGNVNVYDASKYSLQGTTQGNGLTGGLPPVRFSM